MQPFKDFRNLIKESPDTVFLGKKELTWGDPDSITFGWLKAIPSIKPFFLYTRANTAEIETSHAALAETFFNIFSKAAFDLFDFDDYKTYAAISKNLKAYYEKIIELYETDFQGMFYTKPDKFPELAKKIISNPKSLKFLIGNDPERLLLRQSKTVPKPGKMPAIKADLQYGIRTNIFKDAGRLWTKGKVVSFWLTENQVTPHLVETVFEYLSIPDPTKFYIDAVNLKELDKEETPSKKLPSYVEFHSRKSAKTKVSKEDQKKAAEFMAKQHGVAGAQKAKFQDKELPTVGAKKYAQQMPLDVRQKAQTSESLLLQKQN